MAASPNDCNRWWGYDHQWGKWSVVSREDAVWAATKGKVGVIITQKRQCSRCEFEQWDCQMSGIAEGEVKWPR